GIALTAPPGWKFQNAAEALALVNADGNAGLIVRAVSPKAGNTHEEIIRNAVRPDSGKMEKHTFNGLPATHFSGTVKNERGQSQVVELTIATGPSNQNFAFIYAAKDRQSLQRAYRQIQEAEASFRALTEADRAAARPWQLKTVQMPAGGFAELAKQSPLKNNAEQQLRLLNGVYGGGDIKRGELVKTVM
ncbi:MAG: peptidase, partial [Betaproteobacteria bacterium]